MARPSNTASRRSQLVHALSEVMAERGYDGATVQAIAERAGLTPGLLHYHFNSKNEILSALIETLSRKVEDRFLQLLAECQNDPKLELKAFIDAHLALGEAADRNAVSCWIVIGAEAVRNREVQKQYQAVSEKRILELERILEGCTNTSEKYLSKRAIALGILAAIEGSFRLLISSPLLIEEGFAAPTVYAMALGALSNVSTQN